MSLSKALSEAAPSEKDIMTSIFDREFRREKNLDNAKRNVGKEKVVDNTRELSKK